VNNVTYIKNYVTNKIGKSRTFVMLR